MKTHGVKTQVSITQGGHAKQLQIETREDSAWLQAHAHGDEPQSSREQVVPDLHYTVTFRTGPRGGQNAQVRRRGSCMLRQCIASRRQLALRQVAVYPLYT